MRSKTLMSKINLQRGKLTVENRKSTEKKRICSEVSVNSVLRGVHSVHLQVLLVGTCQNVVHGLSLAFRALTLLVGRQEGHPACKKLSGGVLAWLFVWSEVQTCTAQLMPLPPTVSCFSKIQTGFTFLVPAHLGSPGQRAVKRACMCVVCSWPQSHASRIVSYLPMWTPSVSECQAVRTHTGSPPRCGRS